MKTFEVLIMIMAMLAFAQADHYNLPYVQIESNNESIKVSCTRKCELICAPLIEIPPAYFLCVDNCTKRCPEMFSTSLKNCMTGCGSIKFIEVNIDVRGLATHVVNSCLQECQKKK
ncbi:hypothetical protein AAZX31_02G079900 [Glycine max]|uniref:Uncharacterized protein n=2 Tax=Glycine subgen. Soja TaxID=1462606 RepID=K7K750_SOYBN|nr:hypothetical protein JHK87_003391 [Glycine soja]KAG5062518.1 hypothetical protein JHK85_003701 [Glycine max]KAG5079470.1 hypothetical protein JHK86_003535 [Glycine max]KAH1059354.1 hypothetical protein GYH30_003412 [Glycine max]KAH1260665.1 hypothetical protein GmHk_02G003738 [Glycine max]